MPSTLTTESVSLTETGERERTLVEEEGTAAQATLRPPHRFKTVSKSLPVSLVQARREVAEREQGELRDAIDKGKESLDTAAQAAVDALQPSSNPGCQ